MSSQDRYRHRRLLWEKNHRVLPQARHHVWWVLHNLLSHPVLGVWPSTRAIRFHDWTSHHLNQRKKVYYQSPRPDLQNRRAWAWHNIAGHLAIGLLPIGPSFRFHDRTSEAMHEPEWV